MEVRTWGCPVSTSADHSWLCRPPAMALGANKPLAWETATAHFLLSHPQNSFEYSMGSKCVDVSVPVSLNSKVSQKQNTKHFSPSFLSRKSFQGPPCQKGIILNSPSWHIRYSKIISVASSEHCQISFKAS